MASWKDTLIKLSLDFLSKLPTAAKKAFDRITDELRSQGLVKNSLQPGDRLENFELSGAYIKRTGDKVINFALPDHTGKVVAFSQLLSAGPVVLNFYRGGWCPYCSIELRTLQRHLSDITSRGAQLVAISPETPDNSLSTAEKNKLEYTVLSDVNMQIARRFGIVYPVPGYLDEVWKGQGVDIAQANGMEKPELPIPATYVVDQDFTIRYAFLNEDFRERADLAEILAELDKLRQGQIV